MSTIGEEGREYLDEARAALHRHDDPARSAAFALQGILATVVQIADAESREEYLEKRWSETDDCVARYLEVEADLSEAEARGVRRVEVSEVLASLRRAYNGETS